LSAGAFVRQATGLVREFGALDAIWINLSLVGIFFSLVFIASTATLTGGDPLVAGLIALVVMFLMAMAFSVTSVVAPRSASDYVFTSRYFAPSLGWVGNAGYFFATVPIFMGVTITTLVSFGVGALLAYWGYFFNDQGFLNLAGTIGTGFYEYLVGAVITVLFGLLPLFGYRAYRTLHRIVLPLILVGVAVMFIVLATTPQTTALARLDTLTGNSTFVDKINAYGTANVVVPAYSSWGNTLALSGVYVFGFTYIISAIYFAGEVKKVGRNMPLAIIGTLLISLIIFGGATLLSYYAFGYNFLSNLYYASIFNLAPTGLAVTPYLDFLAAAISNNVFVGSFIIIVAIIQLAWYQTNAVAVGSRLLLSWSFDRLMPSFMGDVSNRFHVPVKGMVVCLIIGLLAGVFYVIPFSSSYAFSLSTSAIAIIFIFPILMVGLAMLNFRLRKKEAFNSSALAHTYLGGPLYYIAAIGTILYSVYGVYLYLTIPAFFLNSTTGYEVTFIPIVVLFAIYFIARAVNKSKGVPFDQIFGSIPPE
jgi:glutamate:GABA antiporter